MQIVGKPFDEATILRIGHAYERATKWRDVRPALKHPESYLDPITTDVSLDTIDPTALEQYRVRIESQGMQIDEPQLANLTEAMPHLEAMIERIPKDLEFEAVPSSIFSW